MLLRPKGVPAKIRKQPQRRASAIITQEDATPISTITTPASSVASVPTPYSNRDVDALIIRHDKEGATKPVKIDAKNILGWFRDNAEVTGNGSSDSICRGAKNLFEVVH